ncbi:hypothetical protein [Streptomyces sp. DH37]|uniref:hypothetical protein n=1 Tax=Streptomyces sp. DH37 TaxID=3040122 RepID=UPI0024436910|nr:hypothetical protein [Streptomyces sp. DH37]MDG9704557.1 hypothetical protein [Streptomyces sp. DH37]
MRLRHVRAVAVTAVVLVALTGARKSDGGGCSGDDDSGSGGSSSSSSSGGSGGDSGGSGGSGLTGGSSGSGGGKQQKVMREITVVDCGVDEAGKTTARLRIRNTGRMDMDYSATVAFKDAAGSPRGTAVLEDFEVPAGEVLTTEAGGGAYTGPPDGAGTLRCDVVKAARTL